MLLLLDPHSHRFLEVQVSELVNISDSLIRLITSLEIQGFEVVTSSDILSRIVEDIKIEAVEVLDVSDLLSGVTITLSANFFKATPFELQYNDRNFRMSYMNESLESTYNDRLFRFVNRTYLSS